MLGIYIEPPEEISYYVQLLIFKLIIDPSTHAWLIMPNEPQPIGVRLGQTHYCILLYGLAKPQTKSEEAPQLDNN